MILPLFLVGYFFSTANAEFGCVTAPRQLAQDADIEHRLNDLFEQALARNDEIHKILEKQIDKRDRQLRDSVQVEVGRAVDIIKQHPIAQLPTAQVSTFLSHASSTTGSSNDHWFDLFLRTPTLPTELAELGRLGYRKERNNGISTSETFDAKREGSPTLSVTAERVESSTDNGMRSVKHYMVHVKQMIGPGQKKPDLLLSLKFEANGASVQVKENLAPRDGTWINTEFTLKLSGRFEARCGWMESYASGSKTLQSILYFKDDAPSHAIVLQSDGKNIACELAIDPGAPPTFKTYTSKTLAQYKDGQVDCDAEGALDPEGRIAVVDLKKKKATLGTVLFEWDEDTLIHRTTTFQLNDKDFGAFAVTIERPTEGPSTLYLRDSNGAQLLQRDL